MAVYGEDGREGPVGVEPDLRPATDYGLSKQKCELLILQSELTHCYILRLAPVFDETHLRDARKRAFLPGISKIKLHLSPPPSYSLCHIDTLTKTVLNIIDNLPKRDEKL